MAWNHVKKYKYGGNSDFLELQDGQKALIHFLDDEPATHFQIYDRDTNKKANVPEDYPVPDGIRKRVRHAFRVYNLDEKKIQLLVVSNETAEKLHEVLETYKGSFASIDINFSRKGAKFNDTEYHPTPLPTAFDPAMVEGVQMPDPDRIFADSDETAIQEAIEAVQKANAKNPPKENKKGAAKTTAAKASAPKAEAPKEAPKEETKAAPATGDLDLPAAEPESEFAPVQVLRDPRTPADKKCGKCGSDRTIREGKSKIKDPKTGKPWGNVKALVCAPCNQMEVIEKLPELAKAAA